MKNKFIICFLISLLALLNSCTNYKYLPGRDTRAYWGKDAQYQIMRGKFEYLINLEDRTEIEPMVHKYLKNGDCVYFKGSRGYTILNYQTGNVKQSLSIDSFNDEEKNIFKNKVFKIVTKEEYCELKIDNFSSKNGYDIFDMNLYLGYNPEDITTKDFILKNHNKIINKTVVEWFDNGFDLIEFGNRDEAKLLEFLNMKIPEIKISKLAMRYGVGRK